MSVSLVRFFIFLFQFSQILAKTAVYLSSISVNLSTKQRLHSQVLKILVALLYFPER